MPPASRSPRSRAAMDLRFLRIPGASPRMHQPQRPLMSSSPDRLVYMANQIGKFFQSQGHDKAVPGVAEHIRKFWDPRMRKQIFTHLDAGGAGLDPDVREALET